ncbi:MAG: hypothetical protein N3A72_12450, partial [bacterium]|nr:hypothetical protein [bacterium]
TPAGSLSIKLADTSLTLNSNGLSISTSVINSINDKVSKTQNSLVTSTTTYDTTGNLILNYNITNNNQAVNKAYVDTQIGILTTYADNGLSTKVNKAGDTMTGFLTLSADPTNNLHAATKQYVDNNDALKVSKSGDTMSGALTLHADPVNNLHAATKQYVDSNDALKVNKAGDTMTGFLTLHADPTSDLHAVTKQYVDTNITSINSALTSVINTKVNKAGDTM